MSYPLKFYVYNHIKHVHYSYIIISKHKYYLLMLNVKPSLEQRYIVSNIFINIQFHSLLK